MEYLATAIIVATILANAAVAAADLAKSKWVMGNAAAVGVSESWVPLMAVLKAAAAAGLLLGLFGVPYIDLAAAIGLTLYFVIAVALHIKKRVFFNIYFPAAFLALAVGSLWATW